MEILLATTLIFSIFALFFLLRSLRSLRRRRPLRAGGAGLASVATFAVAASSALLVFNYLTYDRLTAEHAVSVLEFRRVGGDEFQARLMVDGRPDQLFNLRGNEWQLDARVVSWTPPATILGLDPIYRLERISGRYTDIADEQQQQRTVHALTAEQPVDVWTMARRFPMLMPGIDAYYGSATYLPMADGARYQVTLSRDALIARPDNAAARQAVGDWETR